MDELSEEISKGRVLVLLVNVLLRNDLWVPHKNPTGLSSRIAIVTWALVPLRIVDVLNHPVLWKERMIAQGDVEVIRQLCHHFRKIHKYDYV